ncbi:hypothetical protein RMATCC62417_04983 [Rhizopus microsporus]|uniref:S-adenosyl-L-methionine-dependent methyltransferase n=2 Tax=Rhizopus microsporus TaxID=58291 RepID=A0A2G4T8D3_RHIZD|nr:S-adenosyl-L-methionine-dependent methyltransferase [Rhizopus microsporus ATCC 52813]ORE02982.1 S-adenosyl-L-methionine-dependent methyltransferase [Rhizopus microsporus var. microsporus]PHZ17269.1 S-adenosyl-L-methionine-dependent methyltransferase [Rhizopus microsporus ATCC 52813]CEG68791.1 hypothetical protein RMATCC62417_04983 [Rhizopus microsporus]CEJ03231.1 hypothetical protein RMCBS344292_17219 [Rhizopus microsporus]
MSKPQPVPIRPPESKEPEYEQKNVHEVYEVIAEHFSDTRYKPWPVVERFLKSMKPGSLGADIGCGNGKYIGVNPNIVILGSDRSRNLVQIVNQRGHEGMVADALELPYRSNTFDFAISIAVIHHFASPERRLEAIKSIARIVKKGGKMLVFVWALEQTKFSKRDFKPGQQDVLVPWMLTKGTKDADNVPVYNRYYHLFKEGELNELFGQVEDVVIEETGYDRDNHYVIACKK